LFAIARSMRLAVMSVAPDEPCLERRQERRKFMLHRFRAPLAAVSIALSSAAIAHHSPAVFDRSRQVTLTGVVAEFRWGNPHSWMHLDVQGSEDAAERWTIEM